MNITVYLGAKSGKDPAFTEAIHELAAWIAKSNHTLVYGASDIGLMGVLAHDVKRHNGRIIGVGVKIEAIQELRYTNLDEYIETENLQERKRSMMDLADAFVAMPGAVGTLDEVSDVFAELKVCLTRKHCFLFNVHGFYNPLREQLRVMIDNEFLTEEQTAYIHFVESTEEMARILAND